MSEFGVELANACQQVLARHEEQTSHPHCHVNALRDLVVALRDPVLELAGSKAAVISNDTFDEVFDVVVNDHKLRSSDKDLKKVFLDCYRVLLRTPEGGYRASAPTVEDLSNLALLPGRKFLQPDLNKGQIRKMLAHNHVLAFPETLPLLRKFAPPGRPWPEIQAEVENTLVFARPMNQVNSIYVKNEFVEFRMVSKSAENPSDLILDWIPEPAMAFYALESYLEITGDQLDEGCPFDAVERQLSFAIGSSADRLTGNWQARLRDTPFIRIEKGGSQIRVTPDDCLWLAERSMVQPTTIGRVLRQRNEKDALATLSHRIHEHLDKRVKKLGSTPRNLAAYRDAFDMEKK